MINARYQNDGIPVLEINETQKKYLKLFLEKYDSGVYQLEDCQCECGNQTEFETLSEKDRYGLPVKTAICQKCGLVMINPRLTGKSYDLFYETEYPYIYRAIANPDDKYFSKRVKYGHYLVDFIEKNTQIPGQDILEIGCAGGGIVKAFEERGYNSFGIDLSSAYIEFAKAKGVNAKCCHSRELLQEAKRYDLILVNHVLEHFTDIEKELNIIRQLLKKDGIFVVVVPGIKNLLYSYENDFLRFLQNAHTYHFTKDTLIQTLKWHGFEAVYANETVEAIFRLGKKDKLVKNYYNDTIKFIYKLEKVRVNRQKLLTKLYIRIRHFIDARRPFKHQKT